MPVAGLLLVRFICEFLHSQMCMRSYITRVLARAIIKKITLHYLEIPIYVSTHGSCIFYLSRPCCTFSNQFNLVARRSVTLEARKNQWLPSGCIEFFSTFGVQLQVVAATN